MDFTSLSEEIQEWGKRGIVDMCTDCIWCGEKCIPIKQLSNARGYGFYGVCPKCNKETVVQEVDLTLENL